MRQYHRKKLTKLLARADDESFVQLLWATHTLQSEYSQHARRYIRADTIPEGAITTDMTNKFSIQKWEIEILLNELMTTPKEFFRGNKEIHLRCNHWGAAASCVNYLRKLDDSEFKVRKNKEDIFLELGRIAARQFDWQRGYLNMAQFYRNAYVYGQGECAAYFEDRYGLTVNRFSKIGFVLFTLLAHRPVVDNPKFWTQLGVSIEEVEKVLLMISLPFGEAAKIASRQRFGIIHTADKPSILRSNPCLRFGEKGERIRAPLPELILERVTSGVFYDVIGGGGPIREDYGRRFEEYCSRYLSDMLPNLDWKTEFSYRKKPNTLMTPDVLCSQGGSISVAFECKATRMSHQAMFGKDPSKARGYEDLVKAVFQLWRFFSHSRRGYVEQEVAEDAVGVVLTLDNWLILADTMRKHVLAEAEKMADIKDPEITQYDRRPIVFVAIPELERALSISTEVSFLRALREANSQAYWGWRLDDVLRDMLDEDERESRPYPYAKELGELLPWWNDAKKEVGNV